MRKYLITFSNKLQSAINFRLDYFSELIIAALFLISSYFVWNDVYKTKELIAGISREQILIYYLWSGFLASALWAYYNDDSLAEDIQTGSLSQYLTRPINYLIYRFFNLSALVFIKTQFGLVIFLIAGFLLQIPFWQISYLQSLIFLLAFVMAIILTYINNCFLNIIEFWMTGSWGPRWIYLSILATLSGQVIPVNFLPEYLQQIIHFLPFNLYNGFLVEILTNKSTKEMILWNFSKGLIWLAIFLLFLNWLWKKGLKRYEAYGN